MVTLLLIDMSTFFDFETTLRDSTFFLDIVRTLVLLAGGFQLADCLL